MSPSIFPKLSPKVLVRPDQAEKAKGKNVVIGEERPIVPEVIKVQKKLLKKVP